MTDTNAPHAGAAAGDAGGGLKRFIALLTLAMGLAVALFGALTYSLLQGYLVAISDDEQAHRARVIREVMEQRLAFYHDVVNAYGRDPVVRDLIAFGAAGEAVAWSVRVRDSLPQAVGAALFTSDGQVLGEASSQRVGPQCIVDLQRRIRGDAHTLLPIHDDIPALAHFDLTVPVRDEAGESLGLIFVSFSVNELLTVLDRLSTEREAAALVEQGSGDVIATSPNWRAMEGHTERAFGVAGSDWELHVRLAPSTLLPALPAVGGLILAAVFSVIVLMALSGRFLTRRYSREMEDIQAMLSRILAGESLSQDEVQRAGHFFPHSHELRASLAHLGSSHQSLQRDINTDELTGLANRRAFDQRLEELLASGRRSTDGGGFALVLLDLDGLKQVNDRFGHVAGDLLLQAFGEALKRSVRGSDLVSRWGGDEFAALLPQMDPKQLQHWMERLRAVFAHKQEDLAQLDQAARCRVSVGFVHVSPGDGRHAEALIRIADQLLYKDKTEQRRLKAVK